MNAWLLDFPEARMVSAGDKSIHWAQFLSTTSFSYTEKMSVKIKTMILHTVTAPPHQKKSQSALPHRVSQQDQKTNKNIYFSNEYRYKNSVKHLQIKGKKNHIAQSSQFSPCKSRDARLVQQMKSNTYKTAKIRLGIETRKSSHEI